MDAHGGSMPCWAPNGFDDGADAIADSGGIAKHFLTPSATDTAVMEQCGGLFKGIAMLLKNTDDAKDGELLAGLTEQLDALEACAFAPYLSGAAPGLLQDALPRGGDAPRLGRGAGRGAGLCRLTY